MSDQWGDPPDRGALKVAVARAETAEQQLVIARQATIGAQAIVQDTQLKLEAAEAREAEAHGLRMRAEASALWLTKLHTETAEQANHALARVAVLEEAVRWGIACLEEAKASGLLYGDGAAGEEFETNVAPLRAALVGGGR